MLKPPSICNVHIRLDRFPVRGVDHALPLRGKEPRHGLDGGSKSSRALVTQDGEVRNARNSAVHMCELTVVGERQEDLSLWVGGCVGEERAPEEGDRFQNCARGWRMPTRGGYGWGGCSYLV